MGVGGWGGVLADRGSGSCTGRGGGGGAELTNLKRSQVIRRISGGQTYGLSSGWDVPG